MFNLCHLRKITKKSIESNTTLKKNNKKKLSLTLTAFPTRQILKCVGGI